MPIHYAVPPRKKSDKTAAMTDRKPPPNPETLAAQAGGFIDTQTGAIIPPIHPSTTFARNEAYEQIGGGATAATTTRPTTRSSMCWPGLRAVRRPSCSRRAWRRRRPSSRRCRPGSQAVVSKRHVFRHAEMAARRGGAGGPGGALSSTRRTWTRCGPRSSRARPSLVYVETPANPTWAVTDIAAAAEIAHEAGAILAVDSTAASPVLCRPIEHGADLVVHSATKYLNGHSDVIAGAVVTGEESELWQRIGQIRYLAGAVLGPFEAWLLLRGMRTLFVRVPSVLGQRPEASPSISTVIPASPRVCYPGLSGFPGHAVAAKQMSGGFGGMLSLQGRRRRAGGAVSDQAGAAVFLRATSLGGVESLIEHRHTIESPDTEVPEDLLRLSIGLESADDLIADLEQALAG